MTKEDIARRIDISAVKTASNLNDVDEIIDTAREHQFICVFPNPCFINHSVERLKDEPNILIGGTVGFPSGSETTNVKVFQARDNVARGCHEIDMVMNIGKLKSGLYEEVLQDIIAVRDAVAPLPLKVIIETPLLTEKEIVIASKIVMDSQAAFVKTGTGWSGTTTMRHVELIRESVADTIKIKVAGGVRDLQTLQAMLAMGVSRFGIGKDAAIAIMKEINSQN